MLLFVLLLAQFGAPLSSEILITLVLNDFIVGGSLRVLGIISERQRITYFQIRQLDSIYYTGYTKNEEILQLINQHLIGCMIISKNKDLGIFEFNQCGYSKMQLFRIFDYYYD